MSLSISPDLEARLADEARKRGVSVDSLLRRLIENHAALGDVSGREAAEVDLPILHLGPMGALHRREIYDDAD
jgi:hypothetical protein